MTPLQIACMVHPKLEKEKKDRENIIDILLKYGARVNVVSKETLWTPLNWLCLYGDIQLARKFVTKHGALINLPDHRGLFPIDYAGGVRKQNEEMIMLLLAEFKERFRKFTEAANT